MNSHGFPSPHAQQLSVSMTAWFPGFQRRLWAEDALQKRRPIARPLGAAPSFTAECTRAAASRGPLCFGNWGRLKGFGWKPSLQATVTTPSAGVPQSGKAGSSKSGHCPSGAELGECW